MSKQEFILDGPTSTKKLETNFALLLEQFIKLQDQINRLLDVGNTLSERINALETSLEITRKRIDDIEQELKETKSIFADNVRSRNMIIRSYSTTGLVSKFIPE